MKLCLPFEQGTCLAGPCGAGRSWFCAPGVPCGWWELCWGVPVGWGPGCCGPCGQNQQRGLQQCPGLGMALLAGRLCEGKQQLAMTLWWEWGWSTRGHAARVALWVQMGPLPQVGSSPDWDVARDVPCVCMACAVPRKLNTTLAWRWRGIFFFPGSSLGLGRLGRWFVASSPLRRSCGGFPAWATEGGEAHLSSAGAWAGWCTSTGLACKAAVCDPGNETGCLWGRHGTAPLPGGCLWRGRGLSSHKLALKLFYSQPGEVVAWGFHLPESFHWSCPSAGRPRWLRACGPEGDQDPVWLGQWSCWLSSEGKCFVYVLSTFT